MVVSLHFLAIPHRYSRYYLGLEVGLGVPTLSVSFCESLGEIIFTIEQA